jgi:Mor family transcriptional regulator
MMPLSPRNFGIVRDNRAGMTLDEIAAKYGLSLSRVWQIVNNCERRVNP